MPPRRFGIVSLAATLALAATACGGHTSTPAPAVQAVGDTTAKQLLVTGFKAARELGRDDHLCRGCYPAETDEITEEMNARTGGQYAIAFTPLGAHFPDVVYLDTVGTGRLSRRHITLYARTSNGTVWRLDADRGSPQLTVAE